MFDDSTSRPQRYAEGKKPAAILNIFDMFIISCQSNCSDTEYHIINEILVAFRGTCKIRMYMKK